MGWLDSLTTLNKRLATLFDRIEDQSKQVEGLSSDLKQVTIHVAQLQGAMANSANPEIMRQLADLQARIARLEAEAVRTRRSPDARADGSDGPMYLPGNRDDMP